MLSAFLMSMGMNKRYRMLVRLVFRCTKGYDMGIFAWTKGVAKGSIDVKSVSGVNVGFENDVLPLIKRLHNHLRLANGMKQIEF
jgi:hypothetical protein